MLPNCSTGRERSILVEQLVGAEVVIVTRIAPQDPAQVRLADDDAVIEALAAN